MEYKNVKGILNKILIIIFKYFTLLTGLIFIIALSVALYQNPIVLVLLIFIVIVTFTLSLIIFKNMEKIPIIKVIITNDNITLINNNKIIIPINEIKEIYKNANNQYIYATNLEFQLTKLTKKGIVLSRYLDKRINEKIFNLLINNKMKIQTISQQEYDNFVIIDFSTVNQYKLLIEILFK